MNIYTDDIWYNVSTGDISKEHGNLLQGIEGVTVYIDDILVTGQTDEEHVKRLDEVLTRLETAGMRLKVFMRSQVEYLGHRISNEGLQPWVTGSDCVQQWTCFYFNGV